MEKFKLEQDEYYPIREDLLGAFERYLNHGIMPGSFLTAVLENNLCEAVGRADSYNSATLKNIVGFVYNHMPSVSWGSPEKVEAWVEEIRGKNAA